MLISGLYSLNLVRSWNTALEDICNKSWISQVNYYNGASLVWARLYHGYCEDQLVKKNNVPHKSYNHVFTSGMPFDWLYRTKVSTAATVLLCQSFWWMVWKTLSLKHTEKWSLHFNCVNVIMKELRNISLYYSNNKLLLGWFLYFYKAISILKQTVFCNTPLEMMYEELKAKYYAFIFVI